MVTEGSRTHTTAARTIVCFVAMALCVLVGGCSVSGPTTSAGGKAIAGDASARGDTDVPGTASADVAAAPAPKRQTLRVGMILPLTAPGQTALLAETMKKAAELAIFDQDAAHVQLLVRDDKGTPEAAKLVAEELLAERVEIILGPLFAKSVTAAANVARPANVPVVAFSTDRQIAGQGIHLLSFLVGPEVQRVVAYAATQGKRRFAALIPDDAFGRIAEASLREAVTRAGGSVVALQRYPAQPNGMVDPVRQLVREIKGIEEHGDPVDALFLPGAEDTLVSLGPLLKQAEIEPGKMKIIGTGGLDYANAGRDPMLIGAWFAGPDPRGWKDFSEKFARAHGHAPPRIASLAYDAMSLAIALAGGTPGARYIPSNLIRPNGFSGVDGTFRLANDGTTDRNLAVLEVQNFGAAVIDAAPVGFAGDDATGRVADIPVPRTKIAPVN